MSGGCTAPLEAWILAAGGRPVFTKPTAAANRTELPCGGCMHCRVAKQQAWTTRIIHEAQCHDNNWFVTLTYNQDKCPKGLYHRDFQLFMKKLRKNTGQKIRYFMCGEYGEQFKRPHYHVIMFGYVIPDLKIWRRNSEGQPEAWRSKELEETWGMGQVEIGIVNKATAAYTAGYVNKKITGEKAEEHYVRMDPETGEIYKVTPEYGKMSNRPGIGAKWLTKFVEEVYSHDYCIIDGRKTKPPSYYDRKLKHSDAPRLEGIKGRRRDKAMQQPKKERTEARRKVRDIVLRSKLTMSKGTRKI